MILTNNNKWIYSGNKVIDYEGSIPPGPIPPTPPEPTIYNVYTYTKGGGSITATPYTGVKGTEVSLSNTPDSNYQFNSYIVDGSSLIGNTFTIKENDVSVTGVFDRIYDVNITQSTGGTIAANPMRGISGTTVTLSNTPNQGYTFNKYIVTGSTLYDNNKFNIGNSNVNVTAQFNVLPASAILVNLGSNEYIQTESGIKTVQLTGMPNSTHFNYLTFVMDVNVYNNSYIGNASDLYLRNSSNNTIWRMRSHNYMNYGIGFVGITGGVKSWTTQSGVNVTSCSVDDISYRCSSVWYGNTGYKHIRFVFDRTNKLGYFYIGNTLMGYATMTVDPLVIKNIGLQIETIYAYYNVQSRVKNIKVAGFTTLNAAQAWNP